MTDLKLISYYLRMSITRSNDRITLNQTIYLQTILKRFEIIDNKTSLIFINKNFFNIVTFFDDKY